MPRNRTARLAVLGSSARRAAAPPTLGRPRSGRRRVIVIGLVLVSLVLLTISFRESSNGPLHRFEGHASQVLRPFQVAADRIAQPFQDAYGWAHDLVNAKDENKRLRKQVEQLRQQQTQAETAQSDVTSLERLLRYERAPRFPQDFAPVNSEVLSGPAGVFQQTIVVAGGSNRRIKVDDPVVDPNGLVGRISEVGPTTAQVTLLADVTFAASAEDLQTSAQGIASHASGSTETLNLDGVSKDKVVNAGDTVITSGWRRADLSSIYPRGITIGVVTSQSQTDVDVYKTIQIRPSVDFGSLRNVIVLIPRGRARTG
ncbi:MAG: rod shape-determining protein MreC [Gaiellaceae bacterium]